MEFLILEQILSGPPFVDPDKKFIIIAGIEGGDHRFPGVEKADRILPSEDTKKTQRDFKARISNALKVCHSFHPEGFKIALRDQAVAFT